MQPLPQQAQLPQVPHRMPPEEIHSVLVQSCHLWMAQVVQVQAVAQ
jgi:hypothetical protein